MDRPGINTRVAAEFVIALQNGILSLRETRRLVALALAELRRAPEPARELRAVEPIIRAARQLPLARTTREYLARFETRAADLLARHEPDPALLDPASLRERVARALARALGNAGLFSVTDARPGERDTVEVELLVLDTPVRVDLGRDGDGVETLAWVELLEPPEVLDPEIAQRLASILRDSRRLDDAVVHAYAGRPGVHGIAWSVVIESRGRLRARTLTLHGDERASLEPFRYDADEARAMASQLALALGLNMAAESGPFAQLEVLVRASMRTPDEPRRRRPTTRPRASTPSASRSGWPSRSGVTSRCS